MPTGHHHLDGKLSKGHQPLCPRCAPASLPLLKERHCRHHAWGQNPWQSFPLESTFFSVPYWVITGSSPSPACSQRHPLAIPAQLPGAAPHRLFPHAPLPTGFQPILPRMRPWRKMGRCCSGPWLHLLCGPATPTCLQPAPVCGSHQVLPRSPYRTEGFIHPCPLHPLRWGR